MPAKRKTQKEDILKASISIISHEGLNALNARKIAKKLGCSTQPLFYIYENMDVLKKDVIDEIVKIFDREVLKSETGQLEYKDIGINYIRFAKEEHELFKIMVFRPKSKRIRIAVVIYILMFLMSVAYLVTSTYSQFLYFQF